MMTTLSVSWKIWNELRRWLAYPAVRVLFAFNGLPWGQGWQFYGIPVIQKHRQSIMRFGRNLALRSAVRSNPLGPNHAVILCTWQGQAALQIGADFGMTGGSIVAAERITIGDRVTVGANCTIIDTDFHPLNPEQRRLHTQDVKTAPVVIEDDAFIGMNCLILKGVTIGAGIPVGHWAEEADAGRVVSCCPRSFQAIAQTLTAGPCVLATIGHNGRRLACTRFDIAVVSRQMRCRYKSIIQTGRPMPSAKVP